MTEQELISACLRKDRRAQQALYDRFSPTMFGVTRRYLRRTEDAEDVLIDAFIKVFRNLDRFNNKGSFEGWIRRIVVNECLMFLRKNYALKNFHEINERLDEPHPSRFDKELEAQDILRLLDELPDGYRTVFNLYVLEGYKHREIAEELGISINTSKSQLILARRRLQELLEKIGYERY